MSTQRSVAETARTSGAVPAGPADESVGNAFIDAVAARDGAALERNVDPAVRLRALLPSGFREREGASALVALFTSWFEEPERIEVADRVVSVVADRLYLRYRFRERYGDGEMTTIQQDAFCRVRDGRLTTIDLVCSGHRSLPTEPMLSGAREFDAGSMGCGSGLPEEFRRQIEAIPVGAALTVRTRDPSAREDLPSLARLLGHKVVALREGTDGTTIVEVERGR